MSSLQQNLLDSPGVAPYRCCDRLEASRHLLSYNYGKLIGKLKEVAIKWNAPVVAFERPPEAQNDLNESAILLYNYTTSAGGIIDHSRRRKHFVSDSKEEDIQRMTTELSEKNSHIFVKAINNFLKHEKMLNPGMNLSFERDKRGVFLKSKEFLESSSTTAAQKELISGLGEKIDLTPIIDDHFETQSVFMNKLIRIIVKENKDHIDDLMKKQDEYREYCREKNYIYQELFGRKYYA